MSIQVADILVRKGLITAETMERFSRGTSGIAAMQSAIDEGLVDEEAALKALAEEVGLDFIDLRSVNVDLTLLETFPQKLIYRHSLFQSSKKVKRS